jgi:hypothetical protein
MTNEQKDLVIRIFQTGMACGLEHPYEFLTNYVRMLVHAHPYSEIARLEHEAQEAFVELLKGTASCPEEEEELQALTPDKLYAMIEAWYGRGRARRRDVDAALKEIIHVHETEKFDVQARDQMAAIAREALHQERRR